jgi:hypothetical protein
MANSVYVQLIFTGKEREEFARHVATEIFNDEYQRPFSFLGLKE